MPIAIKFLKASLGVSSLLFSILRLINILQYTYHLHLQYAYIFLYSQSFQELIYVCTIVNVERICHNYLVAICPIFYYPCGHVSWREKTVVWEEGWNFKWKSD